MSEIINTEAGCRCNKDGWAFINFEEAIIKVKYPSKIKTKDFLPIGKYAIISQEEEFISGYSNDKDKVFEVSKPVVIFGDHTRNLKYVNFNFVIGADGVKILLPIKQLESKFFYYYLKHQDIPSLGYSRHYKLLKELIIKYPPLSEQQRIVSELDCLNGIIEKQKEQLKQLDELAQSIFYDMFGDPVENEKGWKVKKVKDLGTVVTGNTPSRKESKYYSPSYIEWIKTDNINRGQLNLTHAKEYLSKEGASKGRILPKGSILVTCIAGSLKSIGTPSLANREVCFNQQINAIKPSKLTDSIFLYYLVAIQPEFIQSFATSGMKHIITKSVFENIPVILPPLSLQQQFASKIEAIEHQKELIKESIAETETLFNSRMDYYFS